MNRLRFLPTLAAFLLPLAACDKLTESNDPADAEPTVSVVLSNSEIHPGDAPDFTVATVIAKAPAQGMSLSAMILDASNKVVTDQFTTDFTLHDRGQEVDSAATSARGAQMVYDRIAAALKQKGFVADFETISSAIQSRKIKVFGKEQDVSEIVTPALTEFSTYIDEEVATRFGDKAQRMDGIIVAGGGAYIVGQNVKARYPNAIIPPNPRFAVAEGYSRFGLLTIC